MDHPKTIRRGRIAGFLYQSLEIPFVYWLSQRILAPGYSKFIQPIYRLRLNLKARRVLDLGCGPRPVAPEPAGILVGVDINEAYIRSYTDGFLDRNPGLLFRPPAGRKRLGFVSEASRLPFRDGVFDEARTSSFFHHLTDSQATQAIREMKRCVRPGGTLAVFEDVLPKNGFLRPLAWMIRKLDRGQFMRDQEALLRLFQTACPGEWAWERVTYTYTGLEYLCLRYTRRPGSSARKSRRKPGKSR